MTKKQVDHTTACALIDYDREGAPPVVWEGKCSCGFHCIYPMESQAREGLAHHVYVTDVERVRQALSDADMDVKAWMNEPHKQFDGKTAHWMIGAGRTDEVLAAIERLASGAFS